MQACKIGMQGTKWFVSFLFISKKSYFIDKTRKNSIVKGLVEFINHKNFLMSIINHATTCFTKCSLIVLFTKPIGIGFTDRSIKQLLLAKVYHH